MSAIALVVAAVALYALAYRFYGAFIASKVLITDTTSLPLFDKNTPK